MSRNARITASHTIVGSELDNGYEEPDVQIVVKFDNGHPAAALDQLEGAYREVVRQIEDTKDRKKR